MKEVDKRLQEPAPTGTAGFEGLRESMRGDMSDEDIAKRNAIPETNPVGEPHRQIKEERYVENDEAGHWHPETPDAPGPASKLPLKPGVQREAQKITDRLGVKVGPDDPDYWGLASVMTDEEAALTQHMKVRVPETLEEVAEGAGVSAERAQELLDSLSIKGIIEYNWEDLDGSNPDHEKRYVLPMYVPGCAEFTVMNEEQISEHPEIGTMFERMTYLPLTKVTKFVPKGGAGIGMHVIPVERAINHVNHSVDIEHISHWLKKYDRYAAGACSCTLAQRARGENGGRDAQEWCIGVGDMADYLYETGRGHYITYDQVMDTLRQAEKNGYVHQITNIDGEDKIFAICNCDVKVCYALRTSQLFNTPNMSRSAYVAHVDAEKCVACAGCVEVCPAGAVQLGQKIPGKNGLPEYPRQPLPDDLTWSEADWDWDYRENNRIECHDTGTAPCKVACPAHISVQGYLRLAAQGRYRDALALIKQENPFPAVCGRVCNKRCEAACTRGTVDDAVAIDDVKRFIAEQDMKAEHRFVPERVAPTLRGGFSEKVAIVGAGPAGLTCAFYLAKLGYNPTVFEKSPLPGGMLTYGIPSYKLPRDIIQSEIDVIREMGVEIKCGVEIGRDMSLAELREQGYRAFFLGIGCSAGRLAGVEGEKGEGVETAVDFLRAAADDPNKTVEGTTVVVGGGNVAIDAARVSVRCGSTDVSMYCLEQLDEMPALPHEIEEAREDGIAINNGWGPARVERDADGRVTGVTFKRCTRVFDDDHRFSPVYDESDTVTVPCDRVVMAIGQAIEWGNMLDGEAVETRPNGGALADAKTYQTAQADVFVGGDVYTGPRFVIDAVAAGHEAAISIHRYCQTGSSLTVGRNQRHYVELDKSDIMINPTQISHDPRQAAGTDEVAGAPKLHDWTDRTRTLTEEQIRTETARCLKCGASIVDPNSCIGCGLCTTRCEFDAIHLFRDNPDCSRMIPSEQKIGAIAKNAGARGIRILKNKITKTHTK